MRIRGIVESPSRTSIRHTIRESLSGLLTRRLKVVKIWHSTKRASMSPVLNPICRGLVGYLSYLATCKSSPVYSEYLLYEPLLRIATAHRFDVQCEVDAGVARSGAGDKKRIDFVLTRGSDRLAIEVKWCDKLKIDLRGDLEKLNTYCTLHKALGYVLIFGRKNVVSKVSPKFGAASSIKSEGKLEHWESGRTSYAAKWIRYF